MRDCTGVSLERMLGSAESELVDFLRQCLRWDPRARISSIKALKHPFVRGTTKTGVE